MLCPNCETENRATAKFCDECGFPLVDSAASARVNSHDIPDETPEEEIQAEYADPSEDDADSDATQLITVDGATTSDESEPDAPEIECAEGDVTVALGIGTEESTSAPSLSTDPTVDLTGFDRSYEYGERLVSPDYQPTEPVWRDGGTMKMPQVEGEEAAKGKDYLASSTMKQRKGLKIALTVVAVVVACAAITAFATYQMQLWGGKVVPNVVGMTQADATSVLEESGFTVRSSQVKSDDTEGLVLIMDPNANSRTEKGSEVVIHIATARTIPDVVGSSQEDAEEALAEEGFTNIEIETEKSNEEEDIVLEVSPEAGSRAKSAVEVILTVSEPYIVPDIAGMYLEDAQAAIADAGLQSYIEYVNTQDYPEGVIMGSYPAAGTKVNDDTTVSIQIAHSRGNELIDLTNSLLAPGETITIGLNNYEIQSLDSVEYVGNDTVHYTCTARPFTTILGETVYVSPRTLSGQVVWTSDNHVSSIS